MKNLTAIALLLLLPACAGFQPLEMSEGGRHVKMATAVTVTEAETLDELRTLQCSTGAYPTRTPQECEIELRNEAAALGADVLVIESRTPFPCGYENKETCLTLYSRAFRKKAPAKT